MSDAAQPGPQAVFAAATELAEARRNERRLQALTGTFSAFVWLSDAQGGLVSDLPPWRDITGQTADELLGDGWLAGIHPDDRDHVSAAWQAAVAASAPYDVEYRVVGPTQQRWFHVQGAPVLDDHDEVAEWVGTAVDVTEQRVADDLQAVLTAALDDERSTLEQVIAQAPSAIAVLMGPEHEFRYFNDAYLELVPPGRVRVGFTVADALPEAVDVAVPLLDRALAGERVALDPLKVPFDGPGSFEGHRFYRGEYAPLVQGGRPVGVLVTAMEVTEDVRTQRGLVAELRQERSVAESLQHALLPDELPSIAGLRFAARYATAHQAVGVGGDWYDALALPDGHVLLCMGDIGGRGLSAATQMSQLRAAIRAYANTGADVSAILAAAAAFAQTTQLTEMITTGVGLLDPATGLLRYASAGHLPPLLVGPAGAVTRLAAPPNVPLALGTAGFVYEAVEAHLTVGRSLVLYTDGLVERRDRSLADTLDDLVAHARRCERVDASALAEHLGTFAGGSDAGDDDTALLVVERTR